MAARLVMVLTVGLAAVTWASAGPFNRLQLLLPGEIAAPGTATGKTGVPYVQITNAPFTVTVNAVDANWNLVDTNDVVGITSSDGNAILPANAYLVAGSATFSITFPTTGFATITASNLSHSTITRSVSPEIAVIPQETPNLIFDFTYANRQALLAGGWDFIARTASGAARNTEITNSANGAVISYNQAAHPGVLRMPVDDGDLWDNLNNSRNSIFRNLPTNWTSLQLELTFAPMSEYQQVNLALYQNDDNYVEVAATHYPAVSLAHEVSGVPETVNSVAITGTNMQLRLDRDLSYGNICAFYSRDGTNWIFIGKIDQELVNPRLGIWAGGSLDGLAHVNLRRLRIATNATPFPSTLALQPLALVFNSIVGQPNTNVQRVNIYRTGPDGFKWSVTENASWLSVSSANGSVPGFCDISVNTSGLTSGLHEAVLNFKASGAVTNTIPVPVTLIINANNRVKVATWKGGKKGALSVWIDDSEEVMFDELVTAGFVGTYALMGRGPQSEIFASYHEAGMELGSHTHTHPCFPLDEPARRGELENNITDIITSTPQTEDRLTSFAWPCGANTTREKVWAADYFLISRGYNINQLEDASPKDWMNVKSYNSHEHPPAPPADLKTVVNAAIAQGKWANLTFHMLNNDDGAVAHAVGKDIWVGTGGDVTRYILQRDRTVISNYVQTAAQIRFDGYRLEIPASPRRSFETAFNSNDTVTFQVAVTNLAPVAGVSVGGFARPFTIKTGGGSTNLFFDAVVSNSAQRILITLSNRAVLTVTAANKTRMYGQANPPLTGTLTGVQSGDNITATYATAATTTDPAGTYPITPVLNDPNDRLGNYNVITNLGILTITKSNASVTLGSLSHGYNGSAWNATATTVPAGLAVTFKYNGQTTAPKNAGSYQVIGTINDGNYAGSATNTMIITKSNVSLTLGNLNHTYNGTARSAMATTDPLGLNVNFKYNGQTPAPTNAGTYQVIGTINEVNYAGSATNTMTIAKANASVTLGNLSQGYNGVARNATATTVPPGLGVNFTYNGQAVAPTNVGSYQVIGTINHINYVGSATNTMVITKSGASVTAANTNRVYGQTNPVLTGTLTGVQGGDNITATYITTATTADSVGTYPITPVLNDPDDRLGNYNFVTNLGILTITKSNAPITLGNLSQGYNGAARSVTVATVPAGLIVNLTYAGGTNAPVNAGTYEVIGTIVETNYTGSITNMLTVSPASATVNLAGLTQIYDGAPRVVSVSTVPVGLNAMLTYAGSATAPTNAGSYEVIGTVVEPNYVGSTTNTLIVSPASVTINLTGLTQIYSGTARVVTASTVPDGLSVTISYNGSANAPTNVGNYEVIGTVADANYVGSTTNMLIVSPANATVNLTGLTQIYDGTARVVNASTIPVGLNVTLTYAGSANAPTNVGTYEVIGTVTDTNYTGSSTNTLTISTHPLSVVADNAVRMVGQTNPVFTGIIVGVQNGDNLTASFSSAATVESPVGNYDIVPAVIDPEGRLANYVVTLTNGMLTIIGAPRFSNITRTLEGTVHLQCEVFVGRTYEFQYKDNFADPEWTAFATEYTAASSSVEIIDSSAAPLQRFYRAVDVSDP